VRAERRAQLWSFVLIASIVWKNRSRPGRSLIAPYSLRAATTTTLPGVSAPLRWEELERAVAERRPEGLAFTALDFPARVEEAGDLFGPVLTSKQRLPGSG
jgi:DNA primase